MIRRLDKQIDNYLSDLERHIKRRDDVTLLNVFDSGVVVDLKQVALLAIGLIKISRKKGKRGGTMK